MFTSLDLLIVVVMALVAAGALAAGLMFLVKHKTLRGVAFHVVAALGVYMGTVGFRINWPGFAPQAMLAVVLGLVCVGAVVLAWVKKENEKMFLLARIAAAVALVAGMINAFVV